MSADVATQPLRSVYTTLYVPTSFTVRPGSDAPVAPGIATPFLNHWYVPPPGLTTAVSVSDWVGNRLGGMDASILTTGNAFTNKVAKAEVTTEHLPVNIT